MAYKLETLLRQMCILENGLRDIAYGSLVGIGEARERAQKAMADATSYRVDYESGSTDEQK